MSNYKLKLLFKIIRKIVFYLFISSFIYTVFCKWIFPPITFTQLAFIVNHNNDELHFHRKYVNYNEISIYVKEAVIAAEDIRFYSHHGFDWESIGKAENLNNSKKHKIGASSISQQTAKNIYLWQRGGWLRKFQNFILLILLN